MYDRDIVMLQVGLLFAFISENILIIYLVLVHAYFVIGHKVS